MSKENNLKVIRDMSEEEIEQILTDKFTKDWNKNGTITQQDLKGRAQICNCCYCKSQRKF